MNCNYVHDANYTFVQVYLIEYMIIYDLYSLRPKIREIAYANLVSILINKLKLLIIKEE